LLASRFRSNEATLNRDLAHENTLL
jgi:hypothetical protein